MKFGASRDWHANQTATDADQTAADGDQTASDADQTSADAEQTASDRDRASATADQRASDQDQLAADEDLAAGSQSAEGRRLLHDRSETARGETTLDRQATALMRSEVSRERDVDSQRRYETAVARDLRAEERDQAAVRRDRRAEVVESQDSKAPFGTEVIVIRESTASARLRAAEDRRRAGEDRRRAGEDRDQAARDRESLGLELERAQLDPLTGAYGRAMGKLILRHEIERARRSKESLLLAFADVDGLRALNNSQGHGAGDGLLIDAVAAIRSKLRPYDPVVRWGGDEFVCTFSDDVEGSATGRLAEVETALRETHPGAGMTIGMASLKEGDSLDSLIERADQAMRGLKDQHRG